MRLLALASTLFAIACAVDHTGLSSVDDPDSGIPTDASFDAPTADGPSIPSDGGPPFDGGALFDGSVPMDAGTDAPPAPDAGDDAEPPFDGGPRDAGIDVDPCSVGPDSDSDTVSDACDVCPGSDDRLDVDGDDIPNGCDDWPCGTRPTVPETVMRESIRVNNVSLNGMGNTIVLAPGATFSASFDWNINDEGCSGCIDQIEVGVVPGRRLGCVYDANPRSGGVSGSAAPSLVVDPSEPPGLYELRFNLGQNYGCNYMGASDWWNGQPPASQTFGIICVASSTVVL